MKKIICLLLALVCMFAVVSCGEGTVNAPIATIVSGNAPTKVTTLVSYVGAKTLSGKFVNTIDTANSKSVLEYEFDRYATVAEANAEGSIKTITGKLYCKDGKVSSTEGGEFVDTVVTQAANFKLNLDERNFTTFVFTEDGNSVNATLAPENSASVLGTSVAANGDISISVVTNGKYLNRITIRYLSVDGASVSVDTSYTYTPVTLEF